MARSLMLRPRRSSRLSVWLIPLLGAAPVSHADDLAGVEDPNRARNNYMLNCQGCHGPNGAGNSLADVPKMQGFLGNFLKVDGGRAFLVQVPGSANTALPDGALAEVLNWMLPTMSGSEMPANFTPYSPEEVSRLRQSPESDVIGRRAALIDDMRKRGILTD